MNVLRSLSTNAAMPLCARLLFGVLRQVRVGHLTLVTPQGAHYLFGDPHQQPGAVLHVLDWRACRAILRAGDIGVAQAYRAQWLDSPDFVALLRFALCNEAAVKRAVHGGRLAQLWYNLRHRLRINTRTGSRRNIHAHYDIGNAFYALWLDQSWTYSSACFDGDPIRSLDAAQEAKYRRIVETLGLRPGMRVLEIGCGWGGFTIHAARLGIQVHGVTISQNQRDFAIERIRREGLDGLARVELRDYRDLDGQYDAVVSIEMFEAVGVTYWPVWFRKLRDRLAPDGRALVQTITIDEAHFAAYCASSDFIREYIFPGGMLPSAERFVRGASAAGLHASPALSFGLDYARTLQLWRQRFEANLDTVRGLNLDETFIRTWRLYLAYCEAGFAERRTDVMHFVVARVD
ncbi:cyclopropane-fatty-acyl-phospholipid synthase family protein [Paraburkholderia sp. MMS20-SJTR3]|uniref:Cyclopropane-fatty-acyl-phospholipid synthase family protein n=1 Tax=Paraburkholderia sejongensis TaxID=2886946 RepID=A0ABS8JMJ0_9BURK|nr:cyclopropane-fatty-acyl-phospholipid synthase family protein [Paraburkholderia sp. MMS20-SJTR3]MCC8391094.1 cyclopropane-fatty-acyl-phospholipid synthase family protein [Paraburkholderia sp. MMS20-SJTR3]